MHELPGEDSLTGRLIQTNMSTPSAQARDIAPGDFPAYLDHCGGLCRLQHLRRRELLLPAVS